MGGMILGATVLIVASCSNSGPNFSHDAAPLSAEARRTQGNYKPLGGSVRSEEAFATRAKERPGLATTWGDSVRIRNDRYEVSALDIAACWRRCDFLQQS